VEVFERRSKAGSDLGVGGSEDCRGTLTQICTSRD
jgi:hypothetical protein